ncbi:MAG: T9SS type A sorting domain-containing protein [Saprospiraceae bacterium]|nr:T9SS type A sorting domain-containing protein [Saprospiraceae bacterium]
MEEFYQGLTFPEIREMSIIVINTDGRVLSRNKLISEVSTLDTTQLLPGIYYITVNKNNQIVFSSTFVKIE